jgi:hypothetical protein
MNLITFHVIQSITKNEWKIKMFERHGRDVQNSKLYFTFSYYMYLKVHIHVTVT